MEYSDFKIQTIQKRRINFLLLGILFFASINLIRLFEIQMIKGSYYFSLAKKQHSAKRIIEGKRGEILTKDYFSDQLIKLAQNQSLGIVYATPKYIKNPEEVAEHLSSILKIDKEEIKKKISKQDDLYVVIKRRVGDEEMKKIENLEAEGVGLNYESWRFYSEETLASHILGFVNFESKGNYGIEGYFNKILAPATSFEYLEKDIFGNPIITDASGELKPEDGADIVLTINRDIQFKIEKILEEGVKKYGASKGDIVLMDPYSGEIIAMAGYPNFNPNTFFNYPIGNFKNPAVEEIFEPGSVLKIFTIATGIDTEKINPQDIYYDQGKIIIQGYTIKNADNRAHGNSTIIEALEKSLNMGAIFVVNKVGFKVFYEYLQKFGFGVPSGIELAGEVSGKLAEFKNLSEVNFSTISFGQGIGVTSLQIATATSVIANGGKLMKPYIVKEIIKPDGTKEVFTPKIIREVISPQTAAKLSGMMVSVVEKGSGYKAKIKGYRVAGKTGTAEVPKPGGGYYSQKSIHSFAFFAPADDPKFVGFIKINNPQRRFASATTPPMASEICQFLFNYFKIPPK